MKSTVHGSFVNNDGILGELLDVAYVNLLMGTLTRKGRKWDICLGFGEHPDLVLDVVTPADYTLTQSNWAEYLQFLIASQPDQKLPLKSIGAEITTSMQHLGQLYFQVKGVTTNFVFIVDDVFKRVNNLDSRPLDAKSIFKYATVFEKPSASSDLQYRIVVNENLIRISPWRHNRQGLEVRQQDYTLPFIDRLPPQVLLHIYFNEGRDLKFLPDMFDRSPGRSFDGDALIWKRIGNFLFIQNRDGTLKFTLSPSFDVIREITKKISTFQPSDREGWDIDRIVETRELLSRQFLGLFDVPTDLHDDDIRIKYMKIAVTFHDKYKSATGEYLIEDV